MRFSVLPSILCVVALSLGAGPAFPQTATQIPATPTARPGSPDTEVWIGHSLLGWRAPSAQPGLAEITLAPGADGAAVLQVRGGRSAGTVKLNLHEGSWPDRLVVELPGAPNLVSLSVCDFLWCVETSLGAAPATITRRRPGQHSRGAAAPPSPAIPIALEKDGPVATVPLDWLGTESRSISIRWDVSGN